MGTCGCGDFSATNAIRVPRSSWVGVGVYRGCRECWSGPAVDIMFFDAQGRREWLSNVEPETILPDRYGGKDVPGGIQIALFEVHDLVAAAKVIQREAPITEYESVADWVEDHGLLLIQDAMEMCERRLHKQRSMAGRMEEGEARQ